MVRISSYFSSFFSFYFSFSSRFFWFYYFNRAAKEAAAILTSLYNLLRFLQALRTTRAPMLSSSLSLGLFFQDLLSIDFLEDCSDFFYQSDSTTGGGLTMVSLFMDLMMGSLKYGSINASLALIRLAGSFSSILFIRFRAFGYISSKYDILKSTYAALFSLIMSACTFPSNSLRPVRIQKNMQPMLQISHSGSYLDLSSVMFITSGATQPGVPHLLNKYQSKSQLVASPKSAITASTQSSPLNMMLSGLRSRCIMRFECIYASPSRIPLRMTLTSASGKVLSVTKMSPREPPFSCSTMTQIEF